MTATRPRLTDLPRRLAARVTVERARRQLVRDVAHLVGGRKATPAAASDGPIIGIATFGSGCWHLGLEVLLAHALAQRGARPELLICDVPDLPICDERTIHSRRRDRCAGCIDDKRDLLAASGVRWRGVTSLIAEESLSRARAIAARLDLAGVAAHHERGWPVGAWLHVSACHYLRCDAQGASRDHLDTRRRLLASAIVVVEAVEQWLDAVRPGIVIAESGAHFMWRIALEMARARGIPVICREMGKGGWDRHIYSLNADCMSPDLEAAWHEARTQKLTDADRAAVDRFLEHLPEATYVQRSHPTRGERNLRQRLGATGGAKIAVAFSNVTWDLATAGRDAGFTGVFDWLSDTVQAFGALPGVRLVIRAHPAEASVQTRERIADQMAHSMLPGLERVTLIEPEEPITAADLCEVADLVLVYNSSAGIEAAALGQPVIVCGRPHYRGRGFTVDVTSKAEYRERLALWAAGSEPAMSEPAAELARRYAHLFFLRYHVTMGWTTSPLGPPYRLLIQSLNQLQPGGNAALDVVCDGILHGRQILLPREPQEVSTCNP
jgi:hypothetical protein